MQTTIQDDAVLVLGDTHGNLPFIASAIEKVALTFSIAIIHVVGDFGYWTHTRKGEEFINELDRMLKRHNLLLTFNDGNHENFDDLLAIPIDEDGWRRVTDNIWHAPRGHVWTWGESRFLSFGGANSIDGPDGPDWWKYRFGQGRGPVPNNGTVATRHGPRRILQSMDLGDWWPQEDISENDVAVALASAQGVDIDFMLTHDAPLDVKLPGINGYPKGDQSRTHVQTVMESVQPKALIHGHYHMQNQTNLNGTDIIGLSHDRDTTGQYVIIDTYERHVITPEW